MTARATGLARCLGLVLLLSAPSAPAQPADKVVRIDVLRSGSPPDPFVEALRQGLRDLGYVEGQSIGIEYRWAEGRDERLGPLASDLVRRRVDVIVAGGSQAKVARRALKIAASLGVSIPPPLLARADEIIR